MLTGGKKIPGLSLDFLIRYSQPIFMGHCGRGWKFGMAALSTIQ
jgi:hypothetical protein